MLLIMIIADTSIAKFLPLRRPKVEVPNVFTPNADGINDVLIIKVDGKNGNRATFIAAIL